MNRAAIWFVAGVLGAVGVGAESPGADSQMLAEVRQLRQDLQRRRLRFNAFRCDVPGVLLG